MSGSLSDYASAVTGGNVLSGIMHPATVNPLAAYNDAATTAGNIYKVRDAQAQQAIGGILQQSTDPNGNVDYNKAQTLAAQGGPVVQMGMSKMLQDNATLRTQQLNNAAGLYKLTGMAAMSVAKDGSPANTNASFDSLIASGLPAAEVNKERQRWLAMPDDATRQDEAYRHGLSMLDQLHQVIGQTAGVNTGGQVQPVTITQPTVRGPGGLAVGGGSATTTLSPGELAGYAITYPATNDDVAAGRATEIGAPVHLSPADVVKRFGLGGVLPQGARIDTTQPPAGGGGGTGVVVDSSGKPVGPNNPARLTPPTATPPAPAVPPAPPGAAAGAPVGPGGIGAVLGGGGATPLPVPRVPPPRPQSSNALQGGVPVASANALAPGLGPASPPSPAVTGDVAAMQQGIANARGAPAGGPQMAASFSTGPGIETTKLYGTSADKASQDELASANYQNTVFPYVQALSHLGAGMPTGVGSDWRNSVRSFVANNAKMLGIDPGKLDDQNAMYDGLKKWYASIVTSNPFAAGSDARMSEVLASNPSTGINENASADVMKAGVTMMRMNIAARRTWNQMTPQQQAQASPNGTYLGYLGQFSQNVDVRAFGTDLYNDKQRAKLSDIVSKMSDADATKFLASLKIARDPSLGLMSTQAMP
jgi:hypothetical protein